MGWTVRTRTWLIRTALVAGGVFAVLVGGAAVASAELPVAPPSAPTPVPATQKPGDTDGGAKMTQTPPPPPPGPTDIRG